MLLGIAMLAAGCTSPSQPPAPGGPGTQGPAGVNLAAASPQAEAGTGLRFTWEVQGNSDGVTHSELHFGPRSVPDPAQGVYPGTEDGADVGTGRYQAELTIPAGGLYARAHVIGNGKAVWSSEVHITTPTAVPGFHDVAIPSQVEAGVPFPIRYSLEGSGTSGHVGAHFSAQSSANLPAGFAPGDWPGMGASQHLGAPPVTLPAAVQVNATLPFPGTWYLRPHALLGSDNLWGDEVRITAVDPQQPNIVHLTRETTAVAGTPYELPFALNAQPQTSAHIGAHYSDRSSAALPPGFAPADWPGFRTAQHITAATNLPGMFGTNITFPLPGTWYYRAHAVVANQHVWGPEVEVAVAAPAQPKVMILAAPAEHTVKLGLSTEFTPFEVEWAVLTPRGVAVNHTHVHYGLTSAAAPTEAQGYPAETKEMNGTAPALFRTNVTVSAAGTYYVRAMAIVPGDDGKDTEVWSEERIVEVKLST